MREMDFVPSWYPLMRRRKRWLKLQITATLVSVVALSGWMLESRASVKAKRELRGLLDMKLTQSSEELHLLSEQVELKAQLQKQKQIMDRVGRHVESSRMLALFEKTLTPEMSVTELKMDTMESVRKGSNDTDSRTAATIERRLLVNVSGVAPTDLDISEFLERLSKVRFCENVQLLEASDITQDSHRMRKFAVTFALHLGDGGVQ